MPALSKMNTVGRERYCQNVYEKYVFETSEFLESCDEIAVLLRTYIPSSCYTNFRDLLFHFRCMVNANEEYAMLSQVASIIEHANRSMRDAEVALCVRCVTVFDMIKLKYSLAQDVLGKINAQVDSLQDCILKLRLGSMMLEGMDVLGLSNEDFLNRMNAYFMCAQEYVAKEFKEVIAYSEELKEQFRAALKSIFKSKEESELQNFKAFSTYNDVANLVYESVFEE